ncbi:ribonuclease H [Amanita muscaria]
MKRPPTSSCMPFSAPPPNKKARTDAEDVEDVEGGEWTRVEKRKQRKANSASPRFMYANGEILRRNNAVGIDDIRELVLYLVADAPPPNWLRVDNPQQIEKVVTLLIPGLTSELLGLPPLPTSATSNPNLPLAIPFLTCYSSPSDPPLGTSIPFIASTFSHACPTRAPGDQTRMHSVLSAFFHGPVSGEEKRKRTIQRLASEALMNKDPLQYVLTVDQMIENDYPIPSYMADVFQYPPEWKESPKPVNALDSGRHKIYAIDCEMCMTEDGKELARVCIIDYYTEQVIYDQLVKPSKPVTDYLTRWSGITAETLAPVTTTLAQVQAHILNLLSPPLPDPVSTPDASAAVSPLSFLTPILLGHSLESDLKALKISHPYCIDTAIIYYHPRGRPLKPGLAWLTRKWCNRDIQNRGEGGHDPEEDARACVELLKKKLDMGPGFGEFKVDYESIFERMSRSTRRSSAAVRSAVVDYGNPQMMHGAKATTTVGCTSDDEVLKALVDIVPSHHFAFGRFMALGDVLGWTTSKPTPDAPPPTPAPPPEREKVVETLTTLNVRLKTLHASLPPRTAFIIITGHSDPRRMALLNARKMAFETAIRQGKSPEEMLASPWGGKWSSADGRDLEEAVELTKRGLLFLGVKQ